MKKLLSMIIAALMVFTMTMPAYAKSISKKEALNKALANAHQTKTTVKWIEVELDDDTGNYEVEFTVKKNKKKYEYEISHSTGKILEKSINYHVSVPRKGKKIGKNAAIKKVAKYTGIKVSIIKKGRCTYDDHKYEVKFKKGKKKYEVDVVARTGKIKEYEWKIIK